jgi:biotin carboxylase
MTETHFVTTRIELPSGAAVVMVCHVDDLDKLKEYFTKLVANLIQVYQAKEQEVNQMRELQKILSQPTETSDDTGNMYV